MSTTKPTVALALAIIFSASAAAKAAEYEEKEYLKLLIEMAVYTDKCARFREYRIYWGTLERILGRYGIYTTDLGPDGRFPSLAPRARIVLGEEFERDGKRRCDEVVRKYGPHGYVIPKLMYPFSEPLIEPRP